MSVFLVTSILARGGSVNKYLAILGISIGESQGDTSNVRGDIGDKASKSEMSPSLPPMSPTGKVTALVTKNNSTPAPSVSPMSPTATPVIVSHNTPSPTPTPMLIQSHTPTPYPIATPTPVVTPTPTPSATSSIPPSSDTAHVVINEIAWMGTAFSSSDEWMELYNATDQAVDLTGWTLKSLTGASPDPQITLAGSIQPHGYYLLERTDNTTISDISAGQIYTGALSDTGETLELRDSSGQLLDKVSSEGSWYAGDKASRASMERINPLVDGSLGSNWASNNGIIQNGTDGAGAVIRGTPGQLNSVTPAI